MKQGRKSKTVLALACALVSLSTMTVLASPALAQGPAESEYDLGPLPGAAGDNGAAAGAGGEATSSQVSAEPVATESGGGVPMLLILLIAVAAICTGLAVWRLRKGDGGDDPHGVGPSTGERQSV